ncbi:hypothetical protein AB0N73_06590 [Microbacterium sp. NPDC089189]|uniref:hypothetical protein n=1 Tax=Microbacterium sp. NPDC089189 TaxID=3154972 RepID=UPI00344299F5
MTLTVTTPHDIAAFARAVRTHLDDLPADEVDDLLDGLEADLAEQASDSGAEFTLPDAAAYATELRTAAGLPDRAEGPAPRVPLRERAERLRADAARRIRSSRTGDAVLDLLVSLRPLWWVVRGVALYVTLTLLTVPLLGRVDIVPGDALAWAVLFGSLVLSVQWGRGMWLPTRWLRVVRVGVNAVTSVVAVIMLLAAPTVLPQIFAPQAAMSYEYIDNSQPGLVLDGQRVRNVFAYDAEGRPLTDVQLFTEQGEPLTTIGTGGTSENWLWDQYFAGGGGPVPSPVAGTGTAALWNVFPLRETLDADEYGNPAVDSATTPAPPRASVPAIVPLVPPAGATPAATPLPEATSAPGSTPSADPSAAPTAEPMTVTP